MAQSKASADILSGFSNDLKGKHDEIDRVKESMDRALYEIPWDDPVGHKFLADYQERMKPIEGKLMPNLVAYSQYLDHEVVLLRQYESN